MERKEKSEGEGAIQRLLTVKDVALILGIAPKTVNKLVRERKLNCVQVTTKERRFTEEQVRAYIEVQSRKPIEVGVDSLRKTPLSSSPKKGGEKSFGVSRADLRKEMRLWQ